jgi:hypothetical protein
MIQSNIQGDSGQRCLGPKFILSRLDPYFATGTQMKVKTTSIPAHTRKCHCARFFLVLAVGLFAAAHVEATTLQEAYSYWEAEKFTCRATPQTPGAVAVAFPSDLYAPGMKAKVPNRFPCHDGDMTLFNGLLCASGDSRGCSGVKDAQDASGRFFRSPYQAIPGNSDWGGGAEFSPDHALGAELYLVTTKDAEAAKKWIDHLDSINRCGTINPFTGKGCIDFTPPVWTDDLVNCKSPLAVNFQGWLDPRNPLHTVVRTVSSKITNCSMRPGDIATLYAVVDYFQRNYGMPELPINSRLRGFLSTFADFNKWVRPVNAKATKNGYSTHTMAATVFLMQELGQHGFDDFLREKVKDPENSQNAFFLFLANGGKPWNEMEDVILQSCPLPGSDFHKSPAWLDSANPQPVSDTWHWQNTVSDDDWKHADYWDCIFAAHLAGLAEPKQ